MANYYSTGPPKQAVLFPMPNEDPSLDFQLWMKALKPLNPNQSHFHDLIVLACSFKWSVYGYSITRFCVPLVKWWDLFQPLSHFLSHLYCYQSISIRKQNTVPSSCQLSPRSTSAMPGPCTRISQTHHALNSTFASSANILITVLSRLFKKEIPSTYSLPTLHPSRLTSNGSPSPISLNTPQLQLKDLTRYLWNLVSPVR